MLAVRTHLRNRGATPDEARAALDAHPQWRDSLDALKGTARWKLHALIELDYGAEVARVLLPKRARGPAPYAGPWRGVPKPMRVLINGTPMLPSPIEATTRDDWTKTRIEDVARYIAEHYSNPSTAAGVLTGFRAGLTELGVEPEVMKFSAREEVTKAHNDKIAAAREERVATGFTPPPPYQRIADLVARVDAYIATGGAEPTGQNAADLLVAFSARPGEAETIKIGTSGGVEGALKKRSNAELQLVSSVGLDRARNFLERWRDAPIRDRRRAMDEMRILCGDWGIQARDLRAVGADLAVRAAILVHEANNDGQAREVHRRALRHEPNTQAQDHYTRVNDPLAELFARIRELPAEKIDAVRRLVDSMEAGPSGS